MPQKILEVNGHQYTVKRLGVWMEPYFRLYAKQIAGVPVNSPEDAELIIMKANQFFHDRILVKTIKEQIAPQDMDELIDLFIAYVNEVGREAVNLQQRSPQV